MGIVFKLVGNSLIFRCPHLFLYTRNNGVVDRTVLGTLRPFKPPTALFVLSWLLVGSDVYGICFNCGDVLTFLELMLPYICEVQLLLLEVNRTLVFLGQEHRERSVRPHLLCEPGSVSERGLGRQPQVPVFIVRDFCE